MSIKSIKTQMDLELPETEIEENQQTFSYSSMLHSGHSLRLFSPTYETISALNSSEAYVRHSAMLDTILSRLTDEGAALGYSKYWTSNRIETQFIWRWLTTE
jgi:hypothetical protein